MRHFTNSTTFDVSYLLNGISKKDKRKNHKEHDFSNEAVFDVKDITEK
ncbi:MAG: hypothetical protein PUD43_02835 [Clostridia bacterium]|nr:hypothetical protein [Clostridia bacterium]